MAAGMLPSALSASSALGTSGPSGDTGWKPVVLRRERGLSTLIGWSKNVRKRKISKVNRGFQGVARGRGLLLFFLQGRSAKAVRRRTAVSAFRLRQHPGRCASIEGF